MRDRGAAGSRGRRGLLAVALLGVGALLVTASAASASSLAGGTATITFWNNDNVVTLNIPSTCPNPGTACEWMLTLDEPDVPAQTVVGTAVGTSGILTIPYPSNFCGVIQADLFVGPPPWRLLVGHQDAIQNGTCCPPTTQTVTTQTATTPTTTSGSTPAPQSANGRSNAAGRHAVAARTGGAPAPGSRSGPHTRHRGWAFPGRQTVARGGTGQSTSTTPTTLATPATSSTSSSAACNPMTAVVQTVPASQLPFSTAVNTVPANSAQPATLPFTGLDVKPLVIVGSALILLGIALLGTFEQRRTAARLTTLYSTRAGRWLLGE